MPEIKNLEDLAATSWQRMFIEQDRIDAALAELTDIETKTVFARKLVAEAAEVYAIADEGVDRFAARLADPATRLDAEREIASHPFVDDAITAAGIGCSLVLDAVFADKGGTAHVVVVPAYWSLDLWHFERDLTELGYRYSHWVYATLPAVYDWNLEVPIAYVLVSDQLYGRLHWGDRSVHLYRGEVTVDADYATKASTRVFDPFEPRPLVVADR